MQASAVVVMLERRVGEDMFKRLLERHVVASCHAAQKGDLCAVWHMCSVGLLGTFALHMLQASRDLDSQLHLRASGTMLTS